MPGSVAIEVVLGLVFIYALYSLFTTTIYEMFASFNGSRARMLQRSLERMLMDEDESSILGSKLYDKFWNQPLIKYMNRGGNFKKIPSYISQESFSKAIVDALMECSNNKGQQVTLQAVQEGIKALSEQDPQSVKQNSPQKESDTLRLIKSYLLDSNDDLQKFRLYLEQWFNDMMERTTGWYKRNAQLWTLIIGLSIAIAFNVDSINVVKTLSLDKSAREQIAQLAANYQKNHPAESPDISSQQLDTLASYAISLYKDGIKRSNEVIALGWSYTSWDKFLSQWYISLLGWIITALAISLGAPFWFDLLNKIVQLRGTGIKPPEKDTAPRIT